MSRKFEGDLGASNFYSDSSREMPLTLAINTKTDEPDTKLNQRAINELIAELEDEDDRSKVAETIEKIKRSQINQYQIRELNDLLELLGDSRYKLNEIVSTLQGLLMRLRPSVGGRNRKGAKSLKKRTGRKAGKRTRKN